MSTQPQNPENTSLGLVRPPKQTSPARTRTNSSGSIEPSRKDLSRWSRWRRGIAEEDIAKEDMVDLVKIHSSIQKVLAYMQQNSLEIVTAKVHSVILDQLPDVDRVLTELMSATTTRTVKVQIIDPLDPHKTQTVERDLVEIDYHTRRSAIKALSDLRDMVASKETKTNVNFGTQVQGSVHIGGRSFEDRIRKLRETKGSNPPEEEYLEPEAEDEDEDLADTEDEHIANGESSDDEA